MLQRMMSASESIQDITGRELRQLIWDVRLLL